MNVLELFALTLLIWLASPALLDFLKRLLGSNKYGQDTRKSESNTQQRSLD